jgi:DNA-binding CsgD family transcriptional regulator/N-acetylneuraminic acid mutarotase
MDIVRLLATGATNQQIARELIISVNTVKVHLRNIYAKLEVASRTEATMVAVRQGWVQVPRPDDEIEEATLEATSSPGPRGPERWPRVPLAKRISLVAASLLALMVLFLPQVLQGRGNGTDTDPIGGVFPTAPGPSSSTRWRTRAQMPTPRTGLALVASEGLIYAIGGVSNDGVTAKVEVYDPQADAWTTRQSKPTAVGFISAVEVGGRIYVPGGFDGGVQPRDILEVYDPVQDSWEVRAPIPKPLGAYGLAAYNDRIYLFGGRNEGTYVSSVYSYEPVSDLWEELEPMKQARGFLSASALENRIYVVGGYDDVTEFDTCDVYDPSTAAWTDCSPMGAARGGLSVVPVRGQLYAIGGGMAGYLAFNERYDPRLDTWNRFETPVIEQWRGLGSAFVYPHLYAIGGWNGGFLSTNEAYQALYQIVLP